MLAAVVCIVVAGCLVAAAWLANNEVRVDNGFDRVHRSVDTANHDRRLVLADLAGVRADLDTVDGQVGVDTTTLAQDTTQLQGVESALTGAQADVSTQTSLKQDLQVCLAGVEQALNAISVGDQDHAIAALDAVAASCTSAFSADG